MPLYDYLTDVANAIREKRNLTGLIPAIDFPSEISKIKIYDEGEAISNLLKKKKSAKAFFEDYSGAEIPNISYDSTSNCDNFDAMFYGCKYITKHPQIDMSKAKYMPYMFTNCYKLLTIDIPFLIPNQFNYIAASCASLTKFIIRTMDTTLPFGTQMFTYCYHFTGTTNSSFNPNGLKDGRIYVPDAQVDNLKSATGWADYADIIVPLSTLVE